MNYIQNTADALGVSRSTVYRALDPSQIIDDEKRVKILRYVKEHFPEKYDEWEKRKRTRESGSKKITVVMPYKPRYFWDDAMKGIEKAMEASPGKVELEFIFYPGTLVDNDLMVILDRVKNSDTDGLVLVPVNHPEVREALRKIAERIPVVFFNERCLDGGEFLNVITDASSEGRRAADMVSTSLSDGDTVAILRTEVYDGVVLNDRVRAFTESIGSDRKKLHCIGIECAEEIVFCGREACYPFYTILPSIIARKLSGKLKEYPEIKAIYTPNGILYPLLVALRKLGRNDILVFGHEVDEKAVSLLTGGYHGGCVKQDVKSQAYIALTALIERIFTGKSKESGTVQTRSESYLFIC